MMFTNNNTSRAINTAELSEMELNGCSFDFTSKFGCWYTVRAADIADCVTRGIVEVADSNGFVGVISAAAMDPIAIASELNSFEACKQAAAADQGVSVR